MERQRKTIWKNRRLFIISILLFAILFIPIPSHVNGGPSAYRAVIYTVYSYSIFDGDRYWSGIRIDLFNRTVFDNVQAVWEVP